MPRLRRRGHNRRDEPQTLADIRHWAKSATVEELIAALAVDRSGDGKWDEIVWHSGCQDELEARFRALVAEREFSKLEVSRWAVIRGSDPKWIQQISDKKAAERVAAALAARPVPVIAEKPPARVLEMPAKGNEQ